MKTYIDLCETYKNIFLTNKRLKNRLIRYWGTTTIDGVEVFNQKVVVWPNMNDNAKAVLKLFGAYNSVKDAKFEGITSYYLRFNPNKMSGLNFAADVYANKLNAYVPVDTPFEVSLNYQDENDPMMFANYTSTDIFNYINSNYTTLLTKQYFMSTGNSLAEEIVGLYIFLDDGTDFVTEVVSASVSPVAQVRRVNGQSLTYYTTSINLTLKITRKYIVADTSAMITAMMNETDPARKQIINTILYSTSSPVNVGDDKDTATTNLYWYRGYLRKQTTDSSYLDRDNFIKLISACIDTGYTKKKTSWWKKVLSIVIAVIAVAVAWFTGGQSLTAAFAFNLGVAALALTALQFVIAKSGDTGWASFLGKYVQVISVTSMIAGISAFIKNAGQNELLKTLQEEGFGAMVDKALTMAAAKIETAMVSLAENTLKLVNPASISEILPTLGELGTNTIVSIGSKIAKMVMNMRVDSLKAGLQDLNEQVTQSNEELDALLDKEVNIAAEDIKYYTKPLALDNIVFETDYLYEGTILNIGRPSFYPYGLNIRDKA